MKVFKCNKGECTVSGLLFSISGTKMPSILVKQSNHKLMSKSDIKVKVPSFIHFAQQWKIALYIGLGLDIGLKFTCFTKIESILDPDIENISPDSVQSLLLLLLEIFIWWHVCGAWCFPKLHNFLGILAHSVFLFCTIKSHVR